MRIAVVAYVLGLVAALCSYHPAVSVELNSLIPVETLWVEQENGCYVIRGKNVEGCGDGWQSAMDDLHACADGTVFLETVDRIIVSVDAAACMQDLLQDENLRPSVQLYYLTGKADQALADFTAAHESSATVQDCTYIPLIRETEGRYRIAGTE